MNCFQVVAQISEGGTPPSFAFDNARNSPLSEVPVKVMPQLDMRKIQEEDAVNDANGASPRFGVTIDVDYNLENSGVWDVLPNGDRIWRLKIRSEGADAIGLYYNNFHITEGGKLFIYSADRKKIIGSFTERNNNSNRIFANELVDGNEVILEYISPKNQNSKSSIYINEVLHAYRFIHGINNCTGHNCSADCQVDINCNSSLRWQNAKNSVARVLVKRSNSTSWCSGSLINNNSINGELLFLTAEHCIGGLDAVRNNDPNLLSEYIFYWGYERIEEDCNKNPLFEPSSKETTVGAELLANDLDSDFALLRLNESPRSSNYSPYFNGWSKSKLITGGTVGIHHPKGDVKKISIDTDSPRLIPDTVHKDNNGTVIRTLQAESHWWTKDWDSGTTEGGSSGSPLFNRNGLIIGQLSLGSPGCIGGSHYGSIIYSWNNPSRFGIQGFSPQRRLKDWLDPNCTGGTTLNGSYITPEIFFANNAWYEDYVLKGQEYGLFFGYDLNNFKTDTELRRGDAARVIVNAAFRAGIRNFNYSATSSSNQFFDVSECEFPYAQALFNDGAAILNGGNFNPDEPITLGQFAKLLVNAFNIESSDEAPANIFNTTRIDISTADASLKTPLERMLKVVKASGFGSSNFDDFRAENLLAGQIVHQPNLSQPIFFVKGDEKLSPAQMAKMIVNAYEYKKAQLNPTSLIGNTNFAKSRNSAVEFNSAIKTIRIIGDKFEGPTSVSGNTPSQIPTVEYTIKDNETKEIGSDTHNNIFFYWAANGGEIESLYPTNHRKIRFTPPTVTRPTIFRIYSYFANATGKFREAFIKITVEPSNTTTTNLKFSLENVDFGTVLAGDNVTRTLIVSNPNTSNNTINGYLELPSQYNFFTLETSPNFIIGPGENKQYILKFSPHQKGNYNVGLSVYHDASGEPSPITINVYGEGVENTNSNELNCAVQIPLNCNQLYEGSTVNSINTNNSYQGLPHNYNGGEVVHTFYPPTDGNYQVSFLEQAFGYLDLIILDACDNQQVVGKIFGGGGKRYGSFDFEKNNPYYFVVDGRDLTVGSYDLKIETCPEVPNDGCIISSLDRIDFGYQEPGGTITYVEDLVIRNVSTTSSLEVSISFSGTNAANFSVAHSSFTLGAGQVQLVSPVWNAEANKDYDVEMQITHNSDVCPSPIRIPVTGSTISRYVWTYPVDGSVLRNNESNTITWQGSGAGNVEIEISLDGGVTWTPFSERDDNGTFTFTREGLCTEKGKFRIRKHPFDDPWTETEGFFAIKDLITDPDVYFTYPNGFESFEAGDLMKIRWEFFDNPRESFASGLSTDGIFYIVNNAWSNKLLIVREDAAPQDEMYEWIVPNLPADSEVNLFFDFRGDDDETGCPIYVKAAPTELSFKYYTTENSCTGATDGKIILAPVGGTSPYTYQWTYNGTALTNTSNRLKDLQDGDYAFTITDAANNQTNATIALTSVNNMAAFPQTNDATCGGADGNVAFSITGGTLPYAFDAGNGTTPSTLVPNLTPGRHTISITDNSTCVLVIPVEIGNQENAPNPFFTHQANGTTLSFTNTSTGAAHTWNWDFGDNTTASTASPEHTYASSGLYTVCLTATNDCGANVRCSDIFVGGANPDPNLFTRLYEGGNIGRLHMAQTDDNKIMGIGSYSRELDGRYQNAAMIKFNTDGSINWSKKLINSNDVGSTIAGGIQTSESGGVYFGLNASGADGASDPSPYGSSLLKMDQNGNLIWHKGYKTSDGTTLGIRHFDMYSGGIGILTSIEANIGIFKLNHSGGLNWVKSFDILPSIGLDDDYADFASRIMHTNDGGFLINGSVWNFGGSEPWKNQGFLIKTNSSGTVQWVKTITGGKSDYPISMLEYNGAFYVSGYSNSFTSGNNEIFVAKIAQNGDLVWIKGYESAHSAVPRIIEPNSNGNIEVFSNVGFLELNPNDGNILRQNGTAIGTNFVGRMTPSNDGYNFVSGFDERGFWFGKIDEDGDSKCGTRDINFTAISRAFAVETGSSVTTITHSGSSGNVNILNQSDISFVETNLCPTPTCDVSLSINAVDETCGQNNGAAIANVTGGVPPYIFKWSSALNQNTQSLNDLSAGSYSLTVEDDFGCSKTASFTITDDNTNLSANYTVSSDGLKVNLASSSTGASGYFWDFGDNTISGENNPVHTFDCSGSYLVELTTANDCGYETIGKTVTVDLPDNLPVNGNVDSKVYRADKTITSDGKILTGRNVEFEATETITLTVGFHAQSGSDFLAEIVEDCSTSSCSDGVQNGDEIGIDCGGLDCLPCSCRTLDSLVLVDFYNATGGANWTVKWDLNQPMNTWYGITLNNEGCVEGLTPFGDGDYFHESGESGNGLSGELPNSITGLSNLKALMLVSESDLSGVIPNTISNLTNLEKLTILGTAISGTIPSSITQLTQLTEIRFAANQLTGEIPSGLGQLTNLRTLNLSYNQLTGNIPSDIYNLEGLIFLMLNNNQLTGTLHADLVKLINLDRLRMRDNQFNGCFPNNYTSFCNLTEHWFENNPGLPGGGDFDAFCNSGIGSCTTSTCNDNTQNGDETGVDCGGTNCPACPTTPTLLSLKTTEVKFAYPSAVYANSVNKDALSIIGEETGAKTGTYTVNANVVTFIPSKSFKAGEQLYITSTNAIEKANRTAMSPFTWMEVMPVTNPTNAVFTPLNTGITLPSDALNHSYGFLSADYNQDGRMDIIVNYYPARGSATKNLIYLQNSNGSFAAPLTYSYARSYSSLRGTPDLNGDGYPDLVVTHNVPSSVNVRLNNGDGTLGASSLYTVTNYSGGVEFADIDGDGDIDMIGRSGNASLSSNRISIFRNKGDGTFNAQETISTNNGYGHYLRLGDLDNDGDVDIIYTSSTSFNAIPTFKVYENNGVGSFSLYKSEANPDVRGILPILDFNNDGQKDMISFNTDATVHLSNTGLDFSLGNGTVVASEQGRFHPGDINGDGFIDLLNYRIYNGTNWTSFPYKTYLNNGNGTFTKTDGTLNMKSFQAIRLSDMDDDGDLDYLYVDTDRQIYIAENGNTTNLAEVPLESRNTKSDITDSNVLGEVQLRIMPNPFHFQTTIKYYLPKQSNITLKVLDFLGREITTFAQNKIQAAGWHEQQFQAANNAAGTYFLVLTNGEQQKTEKIILIK